MAFLDDLFSYFDGLTAEHGVEKIKTIGDAYVAVAGAPQPNPAPPRAPWHWGAACSTHWPTPETN